MAPIPDNGTGLTLRELVLEVRDDIKELRTTTDKRLRQLERAGFRLQGAWAVLGVGASVIVGATGLTIAIIGIF